MFNVCPKIFRLFISLFFCFFLFSWIVNEAVYADSPTNFIATNIFINTDSHSFGFDSVFNGNYNSLYLRDPATGNSLASVDNGLCEGGSCVGTFTTWSGGNPNRVQFCIDDGQSTICSQDVDWHVTTNGIFSVSAFDKATGTFTLSITPTDVQQIILYNNDTQLKNSVNTQLTVSGNTIQSNDFIDYDLSGDNYFLAYQTSSTWYLSNRFSINGGSITATASSEGGSTATPVINSITNTITKVVIATPTPTPKPLKDTVAPVVSIDTDFGKPFLKAPKITGKASDSGAINVGVAKVEYSIDNEKNWLPVDTLDSPGARSTTFSFTPQAFEDGNYKLKVRARDPAGNIGFSNSYTLIVDRLPPQIGGVMYSIGAQLLVPNKEGIVFVLPKMDQKITLSAVGGPITVDILAGNQMYSLVKNIDNGLWSGVLSFMHPGIYSLVTKAIDGAENKTERKLNTIVVLDSGKIVSSISPVTSGSVTLWYFDSQTKGFVIWDGRSYGQQNPQQISKNGEYGFFAPSGKYYLEVKSFGFRTLRSEIFTLDIATPITAALKLERSPSLHLGPFIIPLPDFSVSRQSITIKSPVVPVEAQLVSNIIGIEFPNVDLFSDAKKVSTISFRGKPTIFTFLSTWSPYTSQQLSQMEELSGNSQINVLPVISQETASCVSIFQKRGGYSLSIMSDPDGLLVKPLNLSFLPTHVFVNRKGIIQGVKIGVLTKDELLGNMVN